MLCIENNGVAECVLCSVGQVLEFRVAVGQVPALSPPDNLSPKDHLNDKICREEIQMPHIDEKNNRVKFLAIDEAANTQGRQSHLREVKFDGIRVIGLNN